MDKDGFLEKNEIILLLNLSCDRMGVERCSDWQVDYIISLIDDDFNNLIDQKEFLDNYYIVNRE